MGCSPVVAAAQPVLYNILTQSDQYNQHDGQQKAQLLQAQEFPYLISPFENCNISSI
jgi:hypothetical protein